VSEKKGETITGSWPIFRVLQIYPEAREVFQNHGMPCSDCMASVNESIAQGARMHGLDLTKLLVDLNNLWEGE